MAADVASYSRLMREDEATTLSDLRALRRDLLEPEIARCRGQVVKRMGDGWLVEFASAVDAVECALAVQEQLTAHPRIKLRIGVHVGDIVHEDEDVYGDGVNIAARLQDSVDAGTLAISGFAYDLVRGRLAHAFEPAGQQHFKNITDPVEVYVAGVGLRTDLSSPVPVSAAAKVPSIIVLPFASGTGNAETEELAEGLTDALNLALSRFSWFVVLPRSVSSAYKDRVADLATLKAEVDPAYALGGRLRASGRKVWVMAELLDVRSGAAIWSERIDSESDDPFEMEDRISRAILGELMPRILGAEAQRANFSAKGGAWGLVMQGRQLLWHVSEDDVARAQEIFRKVIAMEPENGIGLADLAWTYVYQRIYGWGGATEDVANGLRDSADKAVGANANDAFARAAASYARLLSGESDDAIAFASRVVQLNPNLAVAHTALSLGLFQQGKYESARETTETALELSPRDPLRSMMLAVRGMHLMMLGMNYEMLQNSRDIIRDYPLMPTGHRQMAVALALHGRLAEAKRVVDEDILRLLPSHAATKSGRQVPFGENEAAKEVWVRALSQAGLPE